MAPANAPRNGKYAKSSQRTLKRKRVQEDLSSLVQRVEDLDLKESFKAFTDLPLSEPTLSGLSASHYKTLTDIQSRAVSHALKGRDILGAAKTGSGKTLAFLIPVLENLYRKQWAEHDGLGALILSPTRELAIQIFEVLRKVGRYHHFSAGLVIGGKSLKEEQERLGKMNILDPEYVAVHEAAASATPSTLQQHYVVTPLPQKLDILWSFIRSNLKSKTIVFLSSGKQVRFVYEAFRHLQPGIPLMHLHGRQKQGGRLDITTKYSQAKHAVLFSTDVAARGLDFPAVDWVIQLDCPEDADTYIHRVGRTARYERDGRAVLFLDPSEEQGMLKRLEQKKVPVEKINVKANKQQSIKNQLQNMCFKDPELKYLGQKAFISYVKSVYVQKDKEIFKLKDLDLEEFASSLGLPGAPRIKFIKGDDTKERKNAPRAVAHLSSDDDESDAEDDEKKSKKKDAPQVRTKYDRMFERRNQDVLAGHYTKLINDDGTLADPKATDEADEDNDFLSVKRRFDAGDKQLEVGGSSDESGSDSEAETGKKDVKVVNIDGKEPLVIDSKRREKLLKSKKKLLKFKGKGTKLIYDDEGNAHEIYEMEDEEQFRAKGDAKEQQARFLAAEAERTRLADVEDKELVKQKRREKKEKRKARERELLAQEEQEEMLVQLPPPEDDDQGRFSPSEDEAPRPSKKQRVQFAEPAESEEERRPKKPKKSTAEPKEIQTLEDLESLATGLLG
ncbi:hypothetical protein ATEG_05059 [Aspergillus terreus NIH2624]|uniref:RNA-dependent ATPase HCA4 n=1 Tax=Aspergillus terreus (strain NIH 2624 / FGSC A1156) TaxID=341663 RepID=UPI0000E2C403|nr:uncharacterized protein ATEG_05059 [Aspergillus terreus NIH2624]EAU34128.1 hypothetical protein ATEG_05059 [Aspergillus terreus NIH2624]